MTEEQLAKVPPHTTDSPFIPNDEGQPKLKKPKTTFGIPDEMNIHGAYNRFGNLSSENSSYSGKSGRDKVSAPKTIDNCWFCIDSDKVEEHLITSIGDECYLALPKGGIVPDHVLIIPLDHVTTLSDLSKPMLAEIEKYKDTLREQANSQGKGMVFFERNVKTQYGMVHYLIQCVPVPGSISSDEVQRKFEEISGTRYQITYKVISPSNTANIKAFVKPDAQFFYAELPDKRRLLHVVPPNSRRHPLQLGR